jgi:DHA1 family multidrug/chloramphenicol efflux transport protein-like MFS transporter
MVMATLMKVQAFFGCSVQQAQSMMGYWMIGGWSVILFLGPIADRYGRKRVVVTGAVCFLMGTLLCILTHNLTLFLLGRILQGCACCSLRAAGYAALQELYEGSSAIKILSRMAAISTLSPSLGPLGATFILKYAPFQGVFIFIFALGLLSLVGLIYAMPNDKKAHSETSLINAFKVYKKILSSPLFLIGNACHGMLVGCVACWTVTAPLIIIKEFGFSLSSFGFLQLPVFGASITGALIANKLATTISPPKLIRYGVGLSLLSALMLACKTFFAPLAFPELLAGMALFCVGYGIAFSPLTRFTSACIPYSMSCKSALLFFNSTFIATGFTFGISYLYNGNCNVLAYVLVFFSFLVYLLQSFLKQV